MTNHRFIPHCEKLESRLQLAVLSGIAGPELDSLESAEIGGTDASAGLAETDRPEITLGMEHQGSDSILVIQFATPPSEPCTVCIVGGDTATVQADGTARLRLPQRPGIFELTMGGEGEAQVSFLRIELEPGGHILNHTFLEGEATGTDENIASSNPEFVISPDHSVSMHLISVPNVLSGQAMHGHVALATLSTRSQTANAVMSDHNSATDSGSVHSLMGSSHNSSFSQRMNGRGTAAEVPDSDDATHSGRSFADEIAVVGKLAAPEVFPVAGDENIEDILANWTDGEGSVSAEAAVVFNPHARSGAMPQLESHMESTVRENARRSLEAVFSTHLAEVLPSAVNPAEAESSSLPAISAVAVAVAAAAGAYELERRASRRSVQYAIAMSLASR